MAQLTIPRTGGNFILELDGDKTLCFVNTVSGGGYKAKVTTEKVGAGIEVQKKNTTFEVEPFSAEFGMAVTKPILKWIKASWAKKYARRHGVWHVADQFQKIQYSREFHEALVVETKLPALDATSSKPAFLQVKIQAEYCKDNKGSGQSLPATGTSKQTYWSPANFRLTIDQKRLDSACDMVTKIDELTIKQNVKTLWVGAERYPQIQPSAVEFPDLSFHLPASYAQPFQDWHNETVIKGSSVAATKITTGCIEYMDQSFKKVLFSVELFGLGISACTLDQVDASSEKIQSCKVDLFCHRMDLKYGTGMD